MPRGSGRVTIRVMNRVILGRASTRSDAAVRLRSRTSLLASVPLLALCLLLFIPLVTGDDVIDTRPGVNGRLGGAAPTAVHESKERLGAYRQDVEVAADGQTMAWSAYEPETGAFRLMLREAGVVRPAPVAPRRVAFDVDVGRSAGGDPLLVYSRCEQESLASTSGCDLYAFDPSVDRERLIAVAPRSGEDTRPVVSAGRIVFVRTNGERHALYVASVAGGRATRVP